MRFHRAKSPKPDFDEMLRSATEEAVAFTEESAALRAEMALLTHEITDTLSELNAFADSMKEALHE